MRRHERDVAKIAREHGGRLLRRGNGHLAVELPDGRVFTTAASPTNPDHSLKRLRRDIERYPT